MRFFFILSIVFSQAFYSQSLLEESTSEKFNERGFVNSASFSSSGNEIISDYDGNLSVVYGYPLQFAGGMDGSVSLTYNANVEHRVFYDGIGLDWGEQSGFSLNKPEWILGFKGFALLVLNFENRWFSALKESGNGPQNGEYTVFHVPGYDYCTERYFNESPHKFDQIQLLMSDGSKKTLVNNSPEHNLRIGNYSETVRSNPALANVNFIDGTQILRKMTYWPGDGLQYYFEEDSVHYPDYASNLTRPLRTIWYLKNVINQQGDTLVFSYLPYETGKNSGRRMFEKCVFSEYSTQTTLCRGLAFKFNYVKFAFIGQTLLRGIEIFLGNRPLNYDPVTIALSDLSSGYDTTRQSSSHDRSIEVEYIKDFGGRIDFFKYADPVKTYSFDGTAIPPVHFNTTAHCIDSIKYFSGKISKFNYVPINTIYSPVKLKNTSGVNLDDFYQLSNRDRQTNYMVSRVTKSNLFAGIRKTVDETVYEYGNATAVNRYLTVESKYKKDSMKTTITRRNLLDLAANTAPPEIKTEKVFNYYPTLPRDGNASDYSGQTKLMYEKTILEDGSGTLIVNEWDEGTFESNFWHAYTGLFDLKRTTEFSLKGADVFFKNAKSYEYNYFEITNRQVLNDTKYRIGRTTEKDSMKNLYKYTAYRSPESTLNGNSSFYHTNLLAEEKIYTDAAVYSHKKTLYYGDNFYAGPTSAIELYCKPTAEINMLTLDTVKYIYNTSPQIVKAPDTIPNLNRYSLRKKLFSNGARLEFNYNVYDTLRTYCSDDGWGLINGQMVQLYPPKYKWIYTYPGKIVYTDGVVRDSSVSAEIWNNTTMPAEQQLIYPNANGIEDTIKQRTYYSGTGQPLVEVNANGFISDYDYDALNRLEKARFPGGYINPNTPVNPLAVTQQFSFPADKTTLYQYYKSTSYPPVVSNGDHSFMAAGYIKSHIGLPPGTGEIDGAVKNEATEGEIGSGEISEDPDAPTTASDTASYSGPGTDEPWTGNDPVDSTRICTGFLYHYFAKDMLQNVVSLNSAVYKVKALNATISGCQDNVFIMVPYFYNANNVLQAGTAVSGQFNNNSTLEINMTSVLQEFKNTNKKLAAIKFYAPLSIQESCDTNFGVKSFQFDPAVKPAMFITGVFNNVIDGVSAGSVEYAFDDTRNEVTMTKRLSMDVNDFRSIASLFSFDSYGQLRTVKAMQPDLSFALRDSTSFNFTGKPDFNSDAMNRRTATSYDGFGRPVSVKFLAGTESGSTQQKMVYTLHNDNQCFEQEMLVDEKNDTVFKFLDRFGNVTSTRAGGAATTFAYDQLNRLLAVTSPMGKQTTYTYDNLGNLTAKSSPDEGFTGMKYDKYGRLRFVKRDGSSTAENIVYTRYDKLGRPFLKGVINTALWPQLNGDDEYVSAPNSFENHEADTANMIMQYMYDKKVVFGAFKKMPVVSWLNNLANTVGRLMALAHRDKPGGPWGYKMYSYDSRGRVAKFYQCFPSGGSWVITENSYDHAGNLVKQSVDNKMYYWYNYDHEGKLSQVFSSMVNNRATAVPDARYVYNRAAQIDSLVLPYAGNKKIAYTYNQFRGWVTGISMPGVFTESLGYYPDGNVEQQNIIQAGMGGQWAQLGFNYMYNNRKELLQAFCNTDADKAEYFTYDEDGNMLSKYRSGKQIAYQYQQGNNLLAGITVDENNGSQAYPFLYDSRGNITFHLRKGLSSFDYDHRNLPLQMSTPQGMVKYRYDESGNRIEKIQGGVTEGYIRDHTGREMALHSSTEGYKYFNLFGNGSIGRVDVGSRDVVFIDPESGVAETSKVRVDSRRYYVQDHLGSNRVTIDTTGTVLNAQDYYAFGEILRSYNNSSPNERYDYTGKERDTESGLNYHGARYYDSELGRWLNVDPLADKYPGWSGYNYCMNNPLRFIDPNGMEIDDSGVQDDQAWQDYANSEVGRKRLAPFRKGGKFEKVKVVIKKGKLPTTTMGDKNGTADLSEGKEDKYLITLSEKLNMNNTSDKSFLETVETAGHEVDHVDFDVRKNHGLVEETFKNYIERDNNQEEAISIPQYINDRISLVKEVNKKYNLGVSNKEIDKIVKSFWGYNSAAYKQVNWKPIRK
ncbi:MAG: RHS repeat-associated core domain-containing protein [Ignavibacteriales bacterium]|nr:RHS repeat-associated core domain-containing protein [Ignavibacteriales bacterium]